MDCPIRTFKGEHGNLDCEDCPLGYTTVQTGKTSCDIGKNYYILFEN